jgi:hypothetical protein
MPKSTTFANDFVALIFNGTAIADLAENDTTAPLTNLYASLHVGDPGIGGSQETNETSYTNYTRVAVSRNSGGWTVSGGVSENTALIQFPQCGATGATLTHVAIGTAASGAGKVLYAGELSASLAVSNLIQPQFAAGSLTATET